MQHKKLTAKDIAFLEAMSVDNDMYVLNEIEEMSEAELDVYLQSEKIDYPAFSVRLKKSIDAHVDVAISEPVKTTLLNTLKETIKVGYAQGKRRVLSLKAEFIEANSVYVPFELTLRTTNKRDQNEYEELSIKIESTNNDFPEWVLGRQIIVRNELGSKDIDKYFAVIIPPPEDEGDAPEKESLLITICDDKGREAEIELTERKFSCFFKMQEMLSDSLTELHIDVLDK